MKLVNPASLSRLFTTAVFVVVAVEAQFPFRLPSPPRINFGGFRPLFSRRPRPQQQRPTFQQVQPQPQQPQQQFIQQVQGPPPPPVDELILRPPPQQRPEPRPQPQRPFPPPLPERPSRPPSVPTLSVGFGSPKPETLLQGGRLPPFPSREPNLLEPQQPQPQFINNNNIIPEQQGPSRPPVFSQDNNIIGMSPPPLPNPQPFPQSPVPGGNFGQPPPPATARPVVNTTPVSNALEDLLVNPVPSVNAGVLPLANEQPAQLQFFPPLARQKRDPTQNSN